MAELCVTGFFDPVQSSVNSEMAVFQTDAPVPLLASKKTLSPVVGAVWLPAPPLVFAQFVVGEAFQFVVLPPPTQNLFAIAHPLAQLVVEHA